MPVNFAQARLLHLFRLYGSAVYTVGTTCVLETVLAICQELCYNERQHRPVLTSPKHNQDHMLGLRLSGNFAIPLQFFCDLLACPDC